MNLWESEARALIYKFAKQFRYYEVSHMRKGPAGEEKARVNRELAEEAEKFLESWKKDD